MHVATPEHAAALAAAVGRRWEASCSRGLRRPEMGRAGWTPSPRRRLREQYDHGGRQAHHRHPIVRRPLARRAHRLYALPGGRLGCSPATTASRCAEATSAVRAGRWWARSGHDCCTGNEPRRGAEASPGLLRWRRWDSNPRPPACKAEQDQFVRYRAVSLGPPRCRLLSGRKCWSAGVQASAQYHSVTAGDDPLRQAQGITGRMRWLRLWLRFALAVVELRPPVNGQPAQPAIPPARASRHSPCASAPRTRASA